jgi:hypothetical protein
MAWFQSHLNARPRWVIIDVITDTTHDMFRIEHDFIHVFATPECAVGDASIPIGGWFKRQVIWSNESFGILAWRFDVLGHET